MPRIPSRIETDRNYRRGAVLGLTVAEAFMLIAFALLMLLALWRYEANNERQALERDLRELIALSPEERATVLEMAGNGQLLLARALEEHRRDGPEDIHELARRLQLMQEADLRRLVEATTVWRAEERAQLLEFVALAPSEQSIADLIAILEEGATPEDIRRALALAAQLDPDDLAGIDALRRDIRDRLGERLARQSALSSAIQAAIGDLVEAFGGQIDENGIITFPDDMLFAQGKSRPLPAFRDFLAQACLPWFESLKSLRFDVQEVRIEGHASSDWARATPEVAYFNNLSLSQQRAAEVLRICLENAGNGETGRWARARATAIGFSSSRLILDADGQEDPARSRRVVFSAIAGTEDIFTEIGTAVSN